MALFGPRRLGLALGSGGARGLAHIGVLRALEAEGLAPDVVTGTSMGAIVGAFYAAGVPLDEMEQLAATTDIRSFVEWKETLLGSGEILSSRKLEALLREHLPADFDGLRLPFGCVATDLTHGRAVRFTSGDLATAVLASATIPSVFHQVCVDDMQLVDGSATEPVPVLFARELGAEVVAAVDVSGTGKMPLPEQGGSAGAHPLREMGRALLEGATRPRGTTPIDVLITTQEVLERQIAAPALERANVVISPDVHEIQGLAFANIGDIVAAGEVAAAAAVPEIRRAARRRERS